MHVIAGRYKGRVLNTVSGRGTRPTTGRVRESWASSVLSILPNGFDGIAVLDAFAGSGALGIEALSRGAASCRFFEVDKRAHQTVRTNLANLGITADAANLTQGDVMVRAGGGSLEQEKAFDLVILDPPYARTAAEIVNFIIRLAYNGDLDRGALISYEHATGSFMPEEFPLLQESEGIGRF